MYVVDLLLVMWACFWKGGNGDGFVGSMKEGYTRGLKPGFVVES